MASWEFLTDGPIDLEIRLPAGNITIIAESTQTATVTLLPQRPGSQRDEEAVDRARVDFRNGRLFVIAPEHPWLRGSAALDLTVLVPSESACEVVTASADIRCTGQLGRLKARTASGDLDCDVINGPVVVSTASGAVRLRDAAGPLRVHSASGEVAAERTGAEATVQTASGHVRIETACASVRARTSSGDVRVGAISAGRGEIATVSGDIGVGIPAGVGVYLDLSAVSGQVRSELEPSEADSDADLTLLCRSVSGDVLVSRTAAAQPDDSDT
jgi:hypothetical protein